MDVDKPAFTPISLTNGELRESDTSNVEHAQLYADTMHTPSDTASVLFVENPNFILLDADSDALIHDAVPPVNDPTVSDTVSELEGRMDFRESIKEHSSASIRVAGIASIGTNNLQSSPSSAMWIDISDSEEVPTRPRYALI